MSLYHICIASWQISCVHWRLGEKLISSFKISTLLFQISLTLNL